MIFLTNFYKKNYIKWWKDNKNKIYYPYFFHNKSQKIFGVNIPFICYYIRAYGNNTNLKELME